VYQQPPSTAPAPRKTGPAPAPRKTALQETSSSSARVTINLPAEARVWVDNVYCPVRSFDTPTLEPGRKYFYTVRAEVVRDGQTVVQSRRIILSAGEAVNVNFSDNNEPQTVSR
jgi:uncharacterized protein (TIGR03000 family)